MKFRMPRFGFLYHCFLSFAIWLLLFALIFPTKSYNIVRIVLIVSDVLVFLYFASSLFVSIAMINKAILFDDKGIYQKRFKKTVFIGYASITNIVFFDFHTYKLSGYLVVYDNQSKISFDLYGKAFKYFFEHCNNQKVQKHLFVFMKDHNYE